MRHGVVDLVTAILTMRIHVQHGQLGCAPLYPDTQIETAAQFAVAHPLQRFLIAESLLGFSDGAATHPAQDELMPELVQLAQLFVFPAPLTSPITRISSMTRA